MLRFLSEPKHGNVVAVKKGNEKNDATKALIKALKSDSSEKIYQ